ncbi:23S rRNA (uracil(1939)-C(5))-methyltransferase RlmD [Streptococcus sp. FDAARGOS_256]|uniref:23S rRNA (uracil(1939)-C(5))-methyltransferase RlmD n=1 Tax=Streptococcus sp. FDAARGOS_256 TaxID=1975706 RepID=UPI000BAE07BA|nr:23S rRNA (uracil(1939)-C(5))-methyltransferase RlmD [Streptococcus sp. FDAARGOS_256]PNK70535.1 23S rRNA (uracil(1939)-C(5))-methyltransferase RlmD [Streptococcus sp. FDAARGOS_256]
MPGALKGEDIYCQITSIKRNFVEAKLLKVNKKSKFRVVPACTIYNECGGCQIMHLHYDKQLEFKTDLLHQALKNLLLRDMKNMRSVQLSECRNQSTTVLSFNSRLGNLKSGQAGLYAQNSHYLVELKDCLVQDKETQVIANRLAELLTYHQIPLQMRENARCSHHHGTQSKKNGQVQIIIVTNRQLNVTQLVKDLVKDFPEVVTVAVNTNTAKQVKSMVKRQKLSGVKREFKKEYSTMSFSLSPRAFYQLNPEQTEILYSEAIKALDVSKEDHLIDAYCGVGTIGFAFANKVRVLEEWILFQKP